MTRMWIFGGMIGAAALLGGAIPSVGAQMATAPGMFMASRATAQGTVDKIDHNSRTMTLRLPTGEKIALKVSPEVAQFEQIKRGDPVTVDYLEAMSVSVEPSGSSASGANAAAKQSQGASQAQGAGQQTPAARGATQEMEHAKPGSPSASGPSDGSDSLRDDDFPIASAGDAEAPIASTVEIEEITAPVEAVDAAEGTITLRGPDGSMKLRASPDAEMLRSVKPGDRVTVGYTQAMAIDVNKTL